MEDSTTQTAIDECEVQHLQHLSVSLNAMRDNATMSDVTLVCGERVFPAHSIVLTMSPYFHSALTHEWMEKTSGHITLAGVSPDSMAIILDFMYSGQLKVDLKDKHLLMELLENSDYFQIQDLVQLCFQNLANFLLTTTHFIEMYNYVVELSNQSLIDQVLYFLSKNFGEVSQSKDFELLTSHQLVAIVQHPNVDHSTMETVFESVLHWTTFDHLERLDLLEEWLVLFEEWCPDCLNDQKQRHISIQANPLVVDTLRHSLMASNRDTCSKNFHKRQKLLLFGTTMGTIFDVEDHTWCAAKRLPFLVKSGVDLVAYGNHAFFFGGSEDAAQVKLSAAVVKYCPFTNVVLFNSDNGLIYPVFEAGLGVLNDYIYVVDYVVQRYNPKDNTCQLVAFPNKWHHHPAVMSYENHLYIVGGTGHIDTFLEKYDPVADQWTIVTEIPGPVDGRIAALCEAKLFIIRTYLEPMFRVYDFNSTEWAASGITGGPEAVDCFWAKKKEGRPTLYFSDFVQNIVHQYDVLSSTWSSMKVPSRDEDMNPILDKLWCELLF